MNERFLREYLVIIILLSWISQSVGCGATTHNVIAQLVLQWFDEQDLMQMFEQRPSIFQNGAAFPDWGYPLDGMGSAAEAAHWPPFLNATIQYIREKYPGIPYSDEAQDLITLIFGVATHSVADQIWHDLGIVYISHQGYIQSMADVDFFGSFPDAHDTSDTGGEFMLAHAYDLGFLENIWYFPIFDILNIYYRINHTEVTLEKLLEGNSLLFAATEAARHVEADEYFIYAKKSPFLQEQLWEFFYGGIHDMAVWSDLCWKNLSVWLKNGPVTPFCIVDPSTPERMSAISAADSRRLNRFFNSDFWLTFGKSFVDNVEVTLDTTSGRAIFRNKEPGEIVYKRVKNAIHANSITKSEIKTASDSGTNNVKASSCLQINGGPLLNKSLTITTSLSQSYFGESVAVGDFNLNGKSDLVVDAPGFWMEGAPQTGAVFIFLDTESTSGHQTMNVDPTKNYPNVVKFIGQETGARFGSQVAVVDLNKDGADDLVVSAPSSKWAYMDYRGEIYIFMGNPTTKQLPSQPSFTIFVPGILNPAGPASGAYTNFGTALSAFDIDLDGFLDLVIGSHLACDAEKNCANVNSGPLQRGMVAIFLSSFWASHAGSSKISITDSDWFRYGDSSHNWFGYHVNYISNGILRLLLVGAPATGQNSLAEVGMLYSFLAEDIVNKKIGAQPYFTINGTKQFDRFGGYTSTVGNPYGTSSSNGYIVLSIPSRDTALEAEPDIVNWQAGAALLLKLTDIQPTSQIVDDLIPKGVYFKGSSSFSRLGWSSGWSDFNGDKIVDLFVTEPFANREKGRAYTWYGGSKFPQPGTSIDNCMDSADVCFEYTDTPLQARYGSDIVFFKDNNGILQNVLITSPRDSQIVEMAGSLTILYPNP